jgi:hypothetical protein
MTRSLANIRAQVDTPEWSGWPVHERLLCAVALPPRLALRSAADAGARKEVLVRDIDAAPALTLVLESGSAHATGLKPSYLRP